MPTYPFNCEEHGDFSELTSWDEYMSKDRKWECPECGILCERQWTGKGPAVLGKEKYYDKASLDFKGKEGYETLIKDTEKALKFESGTSPYSKYNIPWETLEKQGRVKKNTSEGAKQKAENAKKAGDAVLNRMSKQDVEKTKKQPRLDG